MGPVKLIASPPVLGEEGRKAGNSNFPKTIHRPTFQAQVQHSSYSSVLLAFEATKTAQQLFVLQMALFLKAYFTWIGMDLIHLHLHI